MRGFPPIHIILVAVAFALLAVPLSRLTFARPAVQQSVMADPVKSAATPTLVRLRFAHAPASVSVQIDGRELLPPSLSSPPATNREARTEIAIPAEGVELLVRAAWPEGTPDTAVTLELEPDGKDTRSETRWSTGAKLDEVITFQWKP